MKTLWLLSLTAGSLLTIGLSVASVASHRRATQLRHANDSLQKELLELRTTTKALTAEKQEAVRQWDAVMNRHAELAARVTELESEAANSVPVATSAVSLKPYRAEAFLGKQPLGLVWIVPRNPRLDTNSQRYVYQPVVALDEKLRRFFEVHHTNIIEQLVEVPVNVSHNYYPEPYYYSYGYYRPGRPTNGLPTQPGSGPPHFNPGDGTIIKQPLGTPAGTIQTYQVIPRLPVEPAPVPPAPRPPGVKPPGVRPPTPTPNAPATPELRKPPASTFRAASL
jgi:hypothetical protein